MAFGVGPPSRPASFALAELPPDSPIPVSASRTFFPKLATTFQNYSGEQFIRDLTAGDISALGGSRVQIGGPTGRSSSSFTESCRYGVGGLTVATLMAGVLLIGFGLARLGTMICFIPHPVITGFTAGTAVIIATGEIKDAYGVHMGAVPADFLERFQVFAQYKSSRFRR